MQFEITQQSQQIFACLGLASDQRGQAHHSSAYGLDAAISNLTVWLATLYMFRGTY